MSFDHKKAGNFMGLAFEAAVAAGQRGEVPVGAVIVDPASNTVLAVAGNEVEARNDPTAHAEVLAIRAAAISFARLRQVVFGAYDPKGGGVDHGPRMFSQPTCHHRPEVIGGIDAGRAEALLKDFFAARR